MTETCAIHSPVLKKILYLGNRRWLPAQHRFKRARVAFGGNSEMRPSPERPSRHDVLRMGEDRVAYIESSGQRDGDDDPIREHGVKRVCALFELPYWAVSSHVLLVFCFLCEL